MNWDEHRVTLLARKWTPNAHPRIPAGVPFAGRFTLKDKPTRRPTTLRKASRGWGSNLADEERAGLVPSHKSELALNKDIAPALARMEALAPGAYRTLHHVWATPHENRGNYGEYNDYDGGEPIIHLSVPKLRGPHSASDYAEMKETGFTTPTPDDVTFSQRTLYHEFGHHLDWHAEQTDPDEPLRWADEAYRYGLPIGVGGRAQYGDNELIAELWAEYAMWGPKARPAARAVGEMMRRAGQ